MSNHQPGHPQPCGGERMPLLLSIRQASYELGIGRTNTYELIACGKLKTVKIGRRRFVPRQAVAEFVASLSLSAIAAKLGAVNPRAAGLSDKTFANIRSDFLAAVKASVLKPIGYKARTQLSPAWRELLASVPQRRAHISASHDSHAVAAPVESTQWTSTTV